MQSDKNKIPKENTIPIDQLPPGAKLSFDNDGNVVFKNRAFRRKPTRLYPKSSQLRKKGKRKKK